MEQAIQDGGCNYLVVENRAPVTIAFVAGQNDADTFVARANELEQDRGAEFIQRQIADLIESELLYSRTTN